MDEKSIQYFLSIGGENMKFKKLMALAMAGVMTLAMAGSAFAAEGEIDEKKEPAIVKEIKANTNVYIPSVNFGYTAQLQAKSPFDDVKPPVTEMFAVNVSINSKAESLTNTFNLAENCTKPGEYVFLVSEDSENTPADWTYDTTQYYVQVLVPLTGDPIYKAVKVGDENKEKQGELKFVNEYKPNIPETDNAAIKITKAVDPDNGDNYSLKQTYKFSTEIDYTDLTTSGGYYQTGAQIDENKWTAIDVTDKKATIVVEALKKNESIFFKDIPQGITFKVTENETKGTLGSNYKGCKITGVEEQTDGSSEATVTYENLTQYKDTTFTNIFENITPTGLAISVAPFVAMFAAVAGAIALYVAAKRRVR